MDPHTQLGKTLKIFKYLIHTISGSCWDKSIEKRVMMHNMFGGRCWVVINTDSFNYDSNIFRTLMVSYVNDNVKCLQGAMLTFRYHINVNRESEIKLHDPRCLVAQL